MVTHTIKELGTVDVNLSGLREFQELNYSIFAQQSHF